MPPIDEIAAAKDHSDLWIGGGLALLGTALGLFGTLVTGMLEKKNQRQKLLRERFEEMTECVAALQPWLGEIAAARSLEEVRMKRPPAHHRRLLILSLIYFPEFKIQVIDFYNLIADRYEEYLKLACQESPLTVGGRVQSRLAREKKEDPISDGIVSMYALIAEHSGKYSKA